MFSVTKIRIVVTVYTLAMFVFLVTGKRGAIIIEPIKLPCHQIHLKTLLSKQPRMLSQTCEPHPKRSLKCRPIGRRQEHLPVLMGIDVITRNSLVGRLEAGCVVLFLINSLVDRFVNIFSSFLITS